MESLLDKYVHFLRRRLQILRKLLKLQLNLLKLRIKNKKKIKSLPHIHQLKDLKIASVLDDFSYEVFKPDVKISQITPNNWKNEFNKIQPNIFFVESAWMGHNGLWKGKITNLSYELIEILKYCNLNNIITVFWNKEDPYHFIDFINTAIYFDYIFTTDIDCIPKYKKYVNHNNIFLLTFAVQPKFHNPIEIYERKNAVSFAGSYYKNFENRNKVFKSFIENLILISDIDIYDRHYNDTNTTLQFPEEYTPFIRGSLKYTELDKAYKGYIYAINLSSITTSSTMFARRVFELIASNTLVLSNETKSIKMLFGDLVISTDDGEELVKKILRYRQEPLYMKKIKLIALRKVLKDHTAEDRLDFIAKKISNEYIESGLGQITVISYITTEEELDNIVNLFNCQTYNNKKLLLVYNNVNINNKNLKNIKFISGQTDIRISEAISFESKYIAGMVTDDMYTENYLLDLILATRYCESNIIGKKAYYELDMNNNMKLRNEHQTYRYVSEISAGSCIIKRHFIEYNNISTWAKEISNIIYNEKHIFSIDEFNYCKNGSKYIFKHNNKKMITDLTNINIGNEFCGKE